MTSDDSLDIFPETVTVWIEDPPESTAPVTSSFLSLPWTGALLWWFPVGRVAEAMIAECLGQSLAAGLSEVASLELAAKVFRGRRVGIGLGNAAFAVQTGASVYDALKQSKPRLSKRLLESIRVGEQRGQLVPELRAASRRLSPRVCEQLVRWTGRSKPAIQFAGVLARLLKDHRLTTTIVSDAGAIAAAGDRRFLWVVASVVESMQDGDSFGRSLHRFPKDFDAMFVQFVDAPASRTALSFNLMMLALK